ncbi:MAG TPA: hypothetical protein VGE45_00280 [Chloroflexia bacterium]|jgi:hypothetical protein
MGLTEQTAGETLDALLIAPPSLYLSLHTAQPVENQLTHSVVTHEMTAGGYTRVDVTGGFDRSGRLVTNPADIEVAEIDALQVATHWGVWSHPTSTSPIHFRFFTAFNIPRTIQPSTPVTIPAGALRVRA